MKSLCETYDAEVREECETSSEGFCIACCNNHVGTNLIDELNTC